MVVNGMAAAVPYVLLDAMGRTVHAGRSPGGAFTLDLHAHGNGVYVLRSLDGTGRSVQVVKR